MPEERKYCLNCRYLELRPAGDGSAFYWCLTKAISPGKSVLGRRACVDYRPWRKPKAGVTERQEGK